MLCREGKEEVGWIQWQKILPQNIGMTVLGDLSYEERLQCLELLMGNMIKIYKILQKMDKVYRAMFQWTLLMFL